MEISIITAVKNDPIGIYATIKSVIDQTCFKKIEYIIVDASTDVKTRIVIAELIKNKNIKYIKSNDNNFYAGLNKGIKASKGKYIGTINSGDIYFSNNVLKYILNKIRNKKCFNLIYGNLVYFNEFKITRVWNIKNDTFKINPFKIGHPSAFIKKEIIVKNKYYSENYNICSDLEFFLKSKNNLDGKNMYINKNIIFMKEGGLSTNILKLPIKIFEDLSILFSYFSLFFLIAYIHKIFVKFPGFFFVNNTLIYKVFLDRLLEISKK